jgi:hypothetical protein
MNKLSLIFDSPTDAQSVRQQLAGIFDALILPVNRMQEAQPPGPYTFMRINFSDLAQISNVRNWLRQKPKDANVFFITRKSFRLEALQAYALGATGLVHHPFDGKSLLRKLYGDFELLAAPASDFSTENAPGVAAAFGALQSVFSSACLGSPLAS